MAVSKIYSKGQITIPKAVRDAAGLAIGDPVLVEARDGQVVVSRPKGVLEFVAPPRSGPPVPWPEAREAAREDRVAQIVRGFADDGASD